MHDHAVQEALNLVSNKFDGSFAEAAAVNYTGWASKTCNQISNGFLH